MDQAEESFVITPKYNFFHPDHAIEFFGFGYLLSINRALRRTKYFSLLNQQPFTRYLGSGTCKLSGRISENNAVLGLAARGLVNAQTSPQLEEFVKSPTTIYCGIDPTASSLHLGNLITLIGLMHFYLRGHNIIALLGGATGFIGDPSGRESERQILDNETLIFNARCLELQIRKILKNGIDYAASRNLTKHINGADLKILNNLNWFEKMSAIEFLRDVGRFARIGPMLMRESVKSRMQIAQGISFTEFSYQLLQAYDFWYLYNYHDCRIQLGGSDQWGNIIAGIDMIQKKRNLTTDSTNLEKDVQKEQAYGLTMPLLLASSGEKLGKSVGNVVWLDINRTSTYEFYQHLMKIKDDDVKKYLEIFTFLEIEEINQIMKQHMDHPENHYAQTRLATETTEFVHGKIGLESAQLATKIIFGSSLENIRGQDLIEAFNNDSCLVSLPSEGFFDVCLDRVAFAIGSCKSKSEARRIIKSGGLYLNNRRITDPDYLLVEKDLIDGLVCVLRTGKSNYRLIHVQKTVC